jgi:hypothetical protein
MCNEVPFVQIHQLVRTANFNEYINIMLSRFGLRSSSSRNALRVSRGFSGSGGKHEIWRDGNDTDNNLKVLTPYTRDLTQIYSDRLII